MTRVALVFFPAQRKADLHPVTPYYCISPAIISMQSQQLRLPSYLEMFQFVIQAGKLSAPEVWSVRKGHPLMLMELQKTQPCIIMDGRYC